MEDHHGQRTATGRLIRRIVATLCVCLGLAASPAFAACTVTTPSTATLGSFSPPAIATAAMPYVATTGSFGCSTGSLLSLFAADHLYATVKAGTVYRLTGTGGTVTYQPSATQDGTTPLVAGTQRVFVNGTTLSLLTNGRAAVPIYIKAQSATNLAPGDYAGSFEVKWDWSFCTAVGLNALGINICLAQDTGTASGIVNVKLTIANKGAIVTISQKTTAEASGTTTNPKAIPGSKLRMMMTIQNPDIVPLDLNTLAVTLPTPAGLRIALDGDGTAAAVVQGADSTGTTGLLFTYTSPSSTSDDVDFSSGGNVWGYVPTAGDAVTQGMVTAVRFTPRGRMAAGTAYTISIPYSVR